MLASKRRLSRGEADDADSRRPPAKRHRVSASSSAPCPGACPSSTRPAPDTPPSRDMVSTLSDELLVRILSYMDERALLHISPVSSRFHRIAADSQLWRPHYYRRFILPRAHRIPGFPTRNSIKLHYSLQKSVLAVDGGRGRRGRLGDGGHASATPSDCVDWKKQYKLRHNWARGTCAAVDEVPVHHVERSPPPQWQTLVKVVEGLAVTADGESGLRAWDLRTRKLIAQTGRLQTDPDALVQPTCLAVDDQRLSLGTLDVSVGFQDGTFGVWALDGTQKELTPLYRQTKSYFGELVAMAYGHPYVLTATRLGFILLYTFDDSDDGAPDTDTPTSETWAAQAKEVGNAVPLPQPHLLTSLKSHSTRLPLALSIRRTAMSVVASIAYTFDALGGWAIGIQDLDIKPSGGSGPDVVGSRVAYTLPTQTRNMKSATPSPGSTPTHSGTSSPQYAYEAHEDGPVRLCYSHPYMLLTLPDNTLVLHLCTSTATSLSISPGIRLWGHTSGISDAEITPRGKAVSVSTRGDEIRLWELEGRVGGSSVEVRPRQQGDGADHESRQQQAQGPSKHADVQDKKNWVGFDDEMVVVLKEARDGRESLMVYDFT